MMPFDHRFRARRFEEVRPVDDIVATLAGLGVMDHRLVHAVKANHRHAPDDSLVGGALDCANENNEEDAYRKCNVNWLDGFLIDFLLFHMQKRNCTMMPLLNLRGIATLH
jgi:hypothetical protein